MWVCTLHWISGCMFVYMCICVYVSAPSVPSFTLISLSIHLCVKGHVKQKYRHLTRVSPDSNLITFIAQYKYFFSKNQTRANFLSAVSWQGGIKFLQTFSMSVYVFFYRFFSFSLSVFLFFPALASLCFSLSIWQYYFFLCHCFFLPLNLPTHSFPPSVSHPHYQLHFNFSPTFSSLQLYSDIQTCMWLYVCLFTGFIFEHIYSAAHLWSACLHNCTTHIYTHIHIFAIILQRCNYL